MTFLEIWFSLTTSTPHVLGEFYNISNYRIEFVVYSELVIKEALSKRLQVARGDDLKLKLKISFQVTRDPCNVLQYAIGRRVVAYLNNASELALSIPLDKCLNLSVNPLKCRRFLGYSIYGQQGYLRRSTPQRLYSQYSSLSLLLYIRRQVGNATLV